MSIESTFDLNEAEYRRVQLYADRLFGLWFDTTECDVEAIEAAIIRMYAREHCAPASMIWCDSPWSMQTIISELTERDALTTGSGAPDFVRTSQDPITTAFNRALSKANLVWPVAWQQRVTQIIGPVLVHRWREACTRARLLMSAQLNDDQISAPMSWARWNGDMLPIYALPALALVSDDWANELLAQLTDLFTLRCGAFAYQFHESTILICRNPVRIGVDEQRRLHGSESEAVRFADGYSLFAWDGVLIGRDLALNPQTLSVQMIDSEANLERRRVMLERFGTQRYVEDSGAQIIGEDECGVLLRKELPGDEPILMVKVINSTAEPDGSFKEYFLRVPPHIESAREGVAWTFGLESYEYSPALQT